MRYDFVGDLFWLKDEMTKKIKNFDVEFFWEISQWLVEGNFHFHKNVEWKWEKSRLGEKHFVCDDFHWNMFWDLCSIDLLVNNDIDCDPHEQDEEIQWYRKENDQMLFHLYLYSSLFPPRFDLSLRYQCLFIFDDQLPNSLFDSKSLSKNDQINVHQIESNESTSSHELFNNSNTFWGEKRVSQWID